MSSEISRPVTTGTYAPALGNQFHKSIRNQEQESLTNWGSGYADLGCEFLLIEELPLHFRINQDVFA